MRIESDDCCLDTSAAEEVVLKRKSSALFTDFIAEADLVIAPTLLTTEVAYVFWKYQKFSKVPMRDSLLPVAVILHAGLLPGVAESTDSLTLD